MILGAGTISQVAPFCPSCSHYRHCNSWLYAFGKTPLSFNYRSRFIMQPCVTVAIRPCTSTRLMSQYCTKRQPNHILMYTMDHMVNRIRLYVDTQMREFIYLGFYVAFNTVQVISRQVVGRAEETSTYSSSGFCTVNCRPTASNYQLSHLRPCREPNTGLSGGRRECYHSATMAPHTCVKLSAHAHSTEIRCGDFKLFKTSVGCARSPNAGYRGGYCL